MNGFNSTGTGEGAGMFDGCSEKYFKKLPIHDLMVCVAHEDNTCDKEKFLSNKVEGVISGSQMTILEDLFGKKEDIEMIEKSDSD